MKRRSQESISNLSMGLIETAFTLLQHQALPVYRKNQPRDGPPIAGTENVPSAIAILLLNAGLDYHLSRLKFLRDIAPHNPPLPHTPYFNWNIDCPLSTKISNLLIQHNEQRLKEQLIEVTSIRDSVAHPKLYTIRQGMNSDLSLKIPKARLVPGASLRSKALQRKQKRSEYTKLLRLPFVPTWISYTDAVTCILVLHRFLNLLERRYGNPYAWIGSMFAKNAPPDFFTGLKDKPHHLISLEKWVKAFYDSLSPADKERVNKTLGLTFSQYLYKPFSYPLHASSKGTFTDIVKAFQTPPKLDFLTKPPPWKP